MIVFYSYSHKDEKLRDELEAHLSILKRQGTIDSWHDRRIQPGSDWTRAIEDNLGTADILLLLVSADFLASDYCYGWEVSRALERHAKGEAIVIPVILRACDWHASPLARLQALPKDGRPVTSWTNRDEAWTDVARGIRRIVSSFAIYHEPERASISEKKDAPMPGQITSLSEGVPRQGPVGSQDEAGVGLSFKAGKVLGKFFVPRQGEARTNLFFELGKTFGNSLQKRSGSSGNSALIRSPFGSRQNFLGFLRDLCVFGFIASAVAFAIGLAGVLIGEKGGDVIDFMQGGLIFSILFFAALYYIKRRHIAVRKELDETSESISERQDA